MNIHCCCLLINSCPTLCDPMDYIACQALPSMGFFRQEYWSGLPSPSLGDLPDPGIERKSPGFDTWIFPPLLYLNVGASLVAQTVNNPLAMWETWVQSLGREDPLGKEMVTHTSILAWRIP